jgi:cell division protein FtsB
MSYIRKTFRVLGGMFKALRIVIIMLVIAGSLALNATLLAWSAGSLAVGTAIEAVTGFRSVGTSLSASNNSLKTSNKSLKASNNSLKTSNTFLTANNNSLKTRNTSLRAKNVTLNGNKLKVAKITGRLARRTSIGAIRNLSSMPFESFPVAGVAVVASVTALEIYDACRTMQDLKELNKLMDHKAPAGSGTVCGLKMPGKK